MATDAEPGARDDSKSHISEAEFVETSPQVNKDKPDQEWHDPIVHEFPDGGFRAWAAVLGASLCLFVGGVEYSFGVYLTYYSSHFLSDKTVSQISWIGSCAAFIHSCVGLITGKLYDDGWFKQIVIVGTVLHVLCFMLLSTCKEYWQVWLSQGLGMGLATGVLYQPALSIVSQYFERRRSFAMGIVMSGASIGGVLFPIMANNLFETVGFGWAIRIQAFIMLGLLIAANLLMTTRLPAHNLKTGVVQFDPRAVDGVECGPSGRAKAGIHKINYRHFFSAPFLVSTVGCFFIQLGTGLPYAYITSFATTEGHISADLQFYLLPLTFAGSAIGSPIFAWVADRVGVFNTVIATTIVSAGLEASILAASTDAVAVVVSVLYGFVASGYQALVGPIYSSLSDTVLEIGHRMGAGFFVIGVATLISSPIQGALLGDSIEEYTWWKPIVFSALSLLAGCLALAVARGMLIKRRNVTKKILGFANL
ncbi:uncharacterized protein MKZ38_004536 [Zalerion maritima]|uniref:Major facilitator superfamily (MFS) profile domain-containing protein n=1 Tax=Zalerion maritima TaxID=339359 RepID=A0AAD5RL63_9PEZI|nr:uncharacterized protein MKZ38_004536 [Zalerion maritima]